MSHKHGDKPRFVHVLLEKPVPESKPGQVKVGMPQSQPELGAAVCVFCYLAIGLGRPFQYRSVLTMAHNTVTLSVLRWPLSNRRTWSPRWMSSTSTSAPGERVSSNPLPAPRGCVRSVVVCCYVFCFCVFVLFCFFAGADGLIMSMYVCMCGVPSPCFFRGKP